MLEHALHWYYTLLPGALCDELEWFNCWCLPTCAVHMLIMWCSPTYAFLWKRVIPTAGRRTGQCECCHRKITNIRPATFDSESADTLNTGDGSVECLGGVRQPCNIRLNHSFRWIWTRDSWDHKKYVMLLDHVTHELQLTESHWTKRWWWGWLIDSVCFFKTHEALTFCASDSTTYSILCALQMFNIILEHYRVGHSVDRCWVRLSIHELH